MKYFSFSCGLFKTIQLFVSVLVIATACSGGGGGDTVPPGNTPPIANAGTDWNTPSGAVETLDSSGSRDSDGDPLTYSWELTGPGGPVALPDPTVANPTFTPSVEGIYTATLIVNDGTVDSTPDSVTIKVGPFNFADYMPLDPLNICTSTMEWTLGPDLGSRYNVTTGGFEIVNYTSGNFTGVTVANPFFSVVASNDGSSVKFLKINDGSNSFIFSTDCAQTAHPDEWSFGVINDGIIKDQTSTHYAIDAVTSACTLADNANQKILFKIQDVTVQGTLYQNTVIMYWLDLAFPFTALNFSGKDTELGIVPPTSVDTGSAAVTDFDIFGFGMGSIAFGGTDAATGTVPEFSEFISTTCVSAPSLTQLTVRPAKDSDSYWSADGTRIAFKSDRIGNFFDIWIMNADGSALMQLTTTPQNEGHPHISPDETKILFYSDRTGNREIWTMNIDGSNQAQLTNNAAYDSGGSWTPDGTQIVFQSERTGNRDIWIMNADGSALSQLTTHTANDLRGNFTPDGKKIVFQSDRSGNNDIWIMDADGSNPIQLTTHTGNDEEHHVSPDGTKVAFQSNRSGNNDIWLMNIDGSGLTQITTHPADDKRAAFNPGGTKIVFQSDRTGNDEIWTIRLP